jgi:hypothetical protein
MHDSDKLQFSAAAAAAAVDHPGPGSTAAAHVVVAAADRTPQNGHYWSTRVRAPGQKTKDEELMSPAAAHRRHETQSPAPASCELLLQMWNCCCCCCKSRIYNLDLHHPAAAAAAAHDHLTSCCILQHLVVDSWIQELAAAAPDSSVDEYLELLLYLYT